MAKPFNEQFEVVGKLKDLIDDEGSYGKVFSATRKKDGVQVAIKMLLKKNDKKNGMKEYDMMRKFNSKYLMPALDYSYVDGVFKIQMPLCDFNLQYWLENGGDNVAVDTITHVFNCVKKGLVALSKQDVLHRDLKSNNILYMASDKLWKLADFGHSRVYNPNYMSSNRGNAFYAAPEKTSTNHYLQSSDVFSFGVVVFDMLVACFARENWIEYWNLYIKHSKNHFKLEIFVHLLAGDQHRAVVVERMTTEPADQRPTLTESQALFEKCLEAEVPVAETMSFAVDMDEDEDAPVIGMRFGLLCRYYTMESVAAHVKESNFLEHHVDNQDNVFVVSKRSVKHKTQTMRERSYRIRDEIKTVFPDLPNPVQFVMVWTKSNRVEPFPED